MLDSKVKSFLRELMDGKSPNLDGLSEEDCAFVSELKEVFDEHAKLKAAQVKLHTRLEKLLDILVEFAQFNFDLEIPISEEADELDGIALGLQTLGQEIEYYQRELMLSSQNLKEAQEMAGIGSWEVDLSTDEMHWSDEMYRIYGMQKSDVKFSELRSRYSVEDAEKLAHLFDRAVKYHEPYHIVLKINVNGTTKYIDAQAKPVFDGDEVRKVVGTAMDITDKYIAQKRLEILNSELEEKVAERTKDLEGFSYSVSHDLRAPLRSILGFSNILKESYLDKLDEEGERLLGIIIRNATKMSNLIEELLTFSRVGVTVPNFQVVDLNQVVSVAWHDVLSSFDEKEKVEVEFADLPTVYGASSLLHQVFVNLFSNALKYSSKKEKIRVKLNFEIQEDKVVKISVADNGCGFNMKYHDKLFGVFQRLHSEDEFPGVGVGLALVKRIVDKHHGKIWAQSELDKGTTFFVKLPIENPLEEAVF